MDEARSPPSVSTEESDDLAKVKVKILIPGLTVDKKIFGPAKPRNGDVDVTFQDSGFKVTALIKDEAGKAVRYEYKVKKLPGMIDVSKCFVQYKKDMIIISLAKKESQPWLPTLAAFVCILSQRKCQVLHNKVMWYSVNYVEQHAVTAPRKCVSEAICLLPRVFGSVNLDSTIRSGKKRKRLDWVS